MLHRPALWLSPHDDHNQDGFMTTQNSIHRPAIGAELLSLSSIQHLEEYHTHGHRGEGGGGVGVTLGQHHGNAEGSVKNQLL